MDLFKKHEDLLRRAVEAVYARAFYAAFPEHPKAYGDDAFKEGWKRYQAWLGRRYDALLQEKKAAKWVGGEVSPYTQQALGVTYPVIAVNAFVERARAAFDGWKYRSPEERAGILLESLVGFRERFFEIAHATMHTTGQPLMMSFQASGPHAADRALEAIAVAYDEISRYAREVIWEKPMGKFSVRLRKTFRALGRGPNVVIGCSTFPVWNSVPGIYAGLMTGNSVIVKPHPGAVLPIAMVVEEIQKVMAAAGMDPNTIQLAADTHERPITKELAEHPDVRIIDYTGGTAFGNYLESLPGKITFTEKAGVNGIVLHSVKDLAAVADNIAFSLCLYSSQMCTSPQNIFIPAEGIDVDGQRVSYDDVVAAIVQAVKGLIEHPKMGVNILGAIQNNATCARAEYARKAEGRILLDHIDVKHPQYPDARIQTPLLMETDLKRLNLIEQEWFGPTAFIVKTHNAREGVETLHRVALKKGAISSGLYTTDEAFKEWAVHLLEQAYVPVSINLTGMIWMNQNAAFSDFHVTSGNPAGNATFTDGAFVTRRFAWVGHREKID